jgi:hypothetical protein
VTYGAGLMLVAAERARDPALKTGDLLGADQSVRTPVVSHMEDLTSSRAFRVAYRDVCMKAGMFAQQ